MKKVSQRQFNLARQDVRFALREYETARRAHLSNPDRELIRREMRLRGLLNYRAVLANNRAALAAMQPVKYITYSPAAGAREARRHASR